MRRVVVCTPSGAPIADADVEEHELVDTVTTCMLLRPDAAIYIDGDLASDGVRKAVLLAMSSDMSPESACSSSATR